jgi:hypothetical protein
VFKKKFSPQNLALYEIMWENMVEPNYRPQTTIWRMRIACWIPQAANIHSEYVLVLLRMRNDSEKAVDKIGTHILCSRKIFFPKNLAFYEIM